jgi:SSS family solute:Na+ symporter
MLAANIGAGSTVGAAGLGYRDGLSAWWWVGAAGLGSLVQALWIGPRMRRVAAEHDLHTVGDYLEWRYDRRVRVLAAGSLWLGTLAILAGQLIALSTVLQAVAGVPKIVGCLIGGAVMTVYFTAGGLLSSAWVNLVQLGVLLVGFALALPFALSQLGGWAAFSEGARASETYWTIWQGGGSGWNYLALLGPAFVVSPGLLQKIYGARDERTVRIGVGANGLALLAFAFVPTLLGMMARVSHPSLPPEQALPTLLVADVPAGIGALGLAALVSAELSTCDAILFMLATSLSRDLYLRFLAPGASDAQVLSVARGAAIAGGVLGVLLALVAETIIGALSVFYSVLSVCLFVPVVAGLYVPRLRTPDALTAILAGLAAMGLVHAATGGAGVGVASPVLVGLVSSGLAAAGSRWACDDQRPGRP